MHTNKTGLLLRPPSSASALAPPLLRFAFFSGAQPPSPFLIVASTCAPSHVTTRASTRHHGPARERALVVVVGCPPTSVAAANLFPLRGVRETAVLEFAVCQRKQLRTRRDARVQEALHFRDRCTQVQAAEVGEKVEDHIPVRHLYVRHE